MRSIATTIFLMALALSSVGCDSKATTSAVSVAPSVINDHDKFVQVERDQEDRIKRIADMKSAWESIRDSKDNGNSGWLEETKGFSKDALDTCDLSDRFARIVALYNAIEANPDDAKTAGLPSSSDIQERFLVGLAGQYLKAFSIAAAKGSVAPCRATEGKTEGLPFTAEDLERLLGNMESLHIAPNDVGMTPLTLRTLHLTLIRRDMPELKKRIADGSGDAIGYVEGTMKDWHYTAKDLGLTAAEMAKINPPDDGK